MPDDVMFQESGYLSYEQMYLIIELRKHYQTMSIWSRALAVSMKFRSEDVDAVFARLLKEARSTYDTMQNFFGAELSQQYYNLLTTQIVAYRSLLEALLANDQTIASESLNQLYQTADALAEFFSRLSPYWDRDQFRYLQYQYFNALYNEALAVVRGDYEQEILIFDNIYDLTNIISDYISRGIMQKLSTPSPQTTS